MDKKIVLILILSSFSTFKTYAADARDGARKEGHAQTFWEEYASEVEDDVEEGQ